MTLQSRLLGVFAQYPDPRVGVLTTEVVVYRGYRYRYPRSAPWISDGASPYLVPGDRYRLPGLVEARCDIARLEAVAVGGLTEEEEAVFRQLPPLLSDEDARIVGAYWVEMIRSGKYYTDTTVNMTEHTKYDALVPWLARLVAAELRLVRKGKQDANALYSTLLRLSHNLDLIADWGHGTHPNIMNLTLGQVLYRARRWHAALARQKMLEAVSTGEVVYRFRDGWTVQRLTTYKHLQDEGRAMGHCIGQGEHYYGTILRGTHAAFSIRDADGHPVVTLYGSVDEDGIVHLEQAKLRENALPHTEEICNRIAEAGVHVGWEPGHSHHYEDLPSDRTGANVYWYITHDLRKCKELYDKRVEELRKKRLPIPDMPEFRFWKGYC